MCLKSKLVWISEAHFLNVSEIWAFCSDFRLFCVMSEIHLDFRLSQSTKKIMYKRVEENKKASEIQTKLSIISEQSEFWVSRIPDSPYTVNVRNRKVRISNKPGLVWFPNRSVCQTPNQFQTGLTSLELVFGRSLYLYIVECRKLNVRKPNNAKPNPNEMVSHSQTFRFRTFC